MSLALGDHSNVFTCQLYLESHFLTNSIESRVDVRLVRADAMSRQMSEWAAQNR